MYKALKSARNVRSLESLQNRMALRSYSVYRTVSAEVAFVIPGLPSLGLLAKMRCETYAEAGRRQSYDVLLERWQDSWYTAFKGVWTRRLIPG